MPAAEPIHIVFTVDGGYAMPLAAAIASIATNADRTARLEFHVFCSRFPTALRNRVAQSLALSGHPEAVIHWQQADLSALQHLRVVHDNHNSLIYLRLLIPDLLPAAVEKAIYLDGDLIAVEDIATLWAEPLGNHALLAVRDRMGTVGSPSGLVNYRDLGLASDTAYFNSGVLVLNLRRWRAENIGGRVLRYLSDHADTLQMGDQDGLNAILAGSWRELDFRWNWQVVPDMRAAMAAGCWGLERSEKSIVHFVTPVKPWLPGSRYAERALFFDYLDRTAWRGWRVPLAREFWSGSKHQLRSMAKTLGRWLNSARGPRSPV